MNDNNQSLLFKMRVFPGVEQQVHDWNRLFPGIGDIDRRALNSATPDPKKQSIQVCFPRVSFLAEGSACLYGILRIKEALNNLCREANIGLCDDSDFFHPDILKKEEERIRALENQFDSQTSKLIVASVQFWMLRPGSKFPDGQVPMSISHASALLCVVQGGPGNLWGGGFENYWFCCLGSPSVPGGTPCFDFFRGNLCITPHEHLGKPEEIGGAASVFVN